MGIDLRVLWAYPISQCSLDRRKSQGDIRHAPSMPIRNTGGAIAVPSSTKLEHCAVGNWTGTPHCRDKQHGGNPAFEKRRRGQPIKPMTPALHKSPSLLLEFPER